MTIDRITVAHAIPQGTDRGQEWLVIHPTARAAREAIDASPLSDGQMMSSTTYHRSATLADVRRLRYDADGNLVEEVI